MDTIEISFKLDDLADNIIEFLPYKLEPLGFEGFFESDSVLVAYITAKNFNENDLNEILAELGISQSSVTRSTLPEKNWNEVWESNFEPVRIGNCMIRAPFHAPSQDCDLDIIIEPKMSFGTGHHATTSLMASEMFGLEFKNSAVLDAGCGTGILSILAEKLGAKAITAIDIDIWSYRNSLENISRNNCFKIEVLHGDISLFKGRIFDVILANINLNIHLSNIPLYASLCRNGGTLLISGILSSDIQSLNNETLKYGFSFYGSTVLDNWALTKYLKN
jgi:ribosomal protein L11 methyltransferase